MSSSRVTTIFAACAMAGMFAFSGPAQSYTANAQDGSAQAIFTLGSGFVNITLTNLKTTTANIVDLLSDLSFSISGGQSISTQSVTPGAPNGTLVCADKTAGCVAGGAGNDWFYGMNGSVGSQGVTGAGDYLLTALVGSNKSLIIGDHSFACNVGGGGGKCPDGLGNSGFQPYYNGSATFHLLIGGIDTSSKISDVVFSFGTQPEKLVGVPIPAAVWLFASGLLGLIGIARRRIGGSKGSNNALAAA